MKKTFKWLAWAAILAFGAIAFAENVDIVDSPKPQWFRVGAYFGASSPNSSVTASTPVVVNGNIQINGDAGIAGSVSFQDAGFVNLSVTALTALSLQSPPQSFLDLNPDGGVGTPGVIRVGGANENGYVASATPVSLWGLSGITFSNATKLDGYGLPGLGSVNSSRAFTFTAISGTMTTASAGTGSVTVTVTDGTNTCTFTGTCAGAMPTTGFAGTATYRMAATAGAGTGCVYAGAAALSASVSASNCGTTTPIGNIHFEGMWQ